MMDGLRDWEPKERVVAQDAKVGTVIALVLAVLALCVAIGQL